MTLKQVSEAEELIVREMQIEPSDSIAHLSDWQKARTFTFSSQGCQGTGPHTQLVGSTHCAAPGDRASEPHLSKSLTHLPFIAQSPSVTLSYREVTFVQVTALFAIAND